MEDDKLDPSIKIRAPLRCDGIGSLDCAENAESGGRMAVRWLPLDANGAAAAKAVEALPAHPTLPRIHQTGRVGSAAYVAMDFPDGQLLSTYLGQPFSAEQLRRVGAQAAEALAAVHAQGVFHGEISADSLLLTGEQTILWDMPLVISNRLTDRRGEERMLSQMARMAPFLSPERARGEAPSAESDIYALGAVLCLAGGGRPPSAQNTLAVVHQTAVGQWSPELPAACPPSLRAILRRMVEVEPRARPTPAEVARLLEDPLRSVETVVTEQQELCAEELRAVRGNRSIAAVALGFAVVIAGLSFVAVNLARSATPNAPPAAAAEAQVEAPSAVAPFTDPTDIQALAGPSTREAVVEELPPAPRARKAVKPLRRAAPSADDFRDLLGGTGSDGALKRPEF